MYPLAPRRRAFTLVELLIVVAIIAVLIGLIVPAVQRARGAADRVACANNLRQLGQAFTAHLVTFKVYPAGASGPPAQGWVVQLLTYLEQDNLDRAYRADPGGPAWFQKAPAILTTRLTVLECPASAQAERLDPGPPPRATIDYATVAYARVPAIPNPVVLEGILRPGATPLDGVTVRDIPDGVSHTVLAVERAGAPEHWVDGKLAAGAVPGGGWADPANNLPLYAFDGPCPMNCDNLVQVYSFHSRGCNTLFADGAVKFVGAHVPAVTFAQLVTRAGQETVQEDF